MVKFEIRKMEVIHLRHRGLQVEQVLNQKGIEISSLGKMIGLNKEHIAVLLGDQFLDYGIIDFIGFYINHDFSNEFPDIREQ